LLIQINAVSRRLGAAAFIITAGIIGSSGVSIPTSPYTSPYSASCHHRSLDLVWD